MTIPQEYLDLRTQEDFGFSAVDESEVTQVTNEETLETTIIRETVSTSNESIARLEQKIDSVLAIYEQTTFGLDSQKQQLEDSFATKETDLIASTQSKLAELEKMIVPLLVNLMKNPEKEYIYWPDRKSKLEEQVNRVIALTRG